MKKAMIRLFAVVIFAITTQACETTSSLEDVVIESPESVTDDKDVEKDKPGTA